MTPARHIPNYERVGGRDTLCRWLQWAQERGMPLQMQLERVAQPLTVKVMGLDLKQNLIRLVGGELDEPPAYAQRFNISGMHTNGSVYLFSGTWVPDVQVVPGEYLVPIPDYVDRVQWREYFRVPTPTSCELRWRDDDGARRARVLNLSCGGLRIFMPQPKPDTEPFVEGQLLNHCEIVLGDARVPLGAAKVQYHFPDEQENGWMIGCEFEHEASQQLSRLVMSLQVAGAKAA